MATDLRDQHLRSRRRPCGVGLLSFRPSDTKTLRGNLSAKSPRRIGLSDYPTSQQAGIGVRRSSSNTTIKTKARQRIKAPHRPELSFGMTSLGSHGNIFVAYRPRSIPFVSTASPLEDPNAASHAAQTGESVRFSSPHTGHWPALGSGFTSSHISPIVEP